MNDEGPLLLLESPPGPMDPNLRHEIGRQVLHRGASDGQLAFVLRQLHLDILHLPATRDIDIGAVSELTDEGHLLQRLVPIIAADRAIAIGRASSQGRVHGEGAEAEDRAWRLPELHLHLRLVGGEVGRHARMLVQEVHRLRILLAGRCEGSVVHIHLGDAAHRVQLFHGLLESLHILLLQGVPEALQHCHRICPRGRHRRCLPARLMGIRNERLEGGGLLLRQTDLLQDLDRLTGRAQRELPVALLVLHNRNRVQRLRDVLVIFRLVEGQQGPVGGLQSPIGVVLLEPGLDDALQRGTLPLLVIALPACRGLLFRHAERLLDVLALNQRLHHGSHTGRCPGFHTHLPEELQRLLRRHKRLSCLRFREVHLGKVLQSPRSSFLVPQSLVELAGLIHRGRDASCISFSCMDHCLLQEGLRLAHFVARRGVELSCI
mmetsp:Transcript_40910/g.85631  ORF Transcript_40910/g.85631 Transcript_40910/m.85631 type:complete len:434 (-) Transcript_40910:504-1805(-)